ncbi:hypothetical protein ABPG75_000266 [Micractinium tetrahymenae]
MAAPPEVQEVVAAHAPHFSVVEEDGRVKVKCELNGHTFPARADALEAFISGKKYAKLVKEAQLDVDLKKYEPFIVRSKNLPGMLFCALTGELLNARVHEVKAHLKGRKFGRAKERFEADEQELLKEPEMAEGMDEDEPEGSDGPGFWVPEEVLDEYEMADAEGPEAAAGDEDEGEEAVEAQDGEGEEQAAGQAGGEAGKAAAGKPQQRQQQQNKQQRTKGKGKSSERAAADGGRPAAGKGKQQQKAAGSKAEQQQKQQKQQGGKERGAANGSAGGSGSGKGRAPKAKRVRTG